MFRNTFRKMVLGALPLLALGACLNLKKLGDYSTASLQGLSGFEAIGYSFSADCNYKCELDQLARRRLERGACDCRANLEADSIALLIQTACRNYFLALGRLAGSELTAYDVTSLVKAISTGDFGVISISRKQADAYALLSNTLLRAATDAWRKRKIATYIAAANAPLQTLLSSLDFALESALAKKLEVRKQLLVAYYFDLLQSPGNSPYEQTMIISAYNRAVAETDQLKLRIAIYGKTLSAIGKGHQQLAGKGNRLNARDTRLLLAGWSSDLQKIIAAFNSLKKPN